MLKAKSGFKLRGGNHARSQTEIGVANTVRFINQFSTGYGNYTEERENLLRI